MTTEWRSHPHWPQWVCQTRNVQDSGSSASVQQVGHRPPRAADSAQRMLGMSPQQDGGAIKQPLMSSFASCPQAQQPQCWLLALCQTHFCSRPRTGCTVSTGAPYPPPGHPRTPSYLGVPLIHRAVHREGADWEERERVGVTPLLRGESPVLLDGVHWGPIHLGAPTQNSLYRNDMLGLILLPSPGCCPKGVSPRGCPEA